MLTSSIKPTIGRIVHVYNPSYWNGPAAGDVVHVYDDGTIEVHAKVARRAQKTDSGAGLTDFLRLAIYDPLTKEEREGLTAWAEWMPFQKGQAERIEKPTDEKLENRFTYHKPFGNQTDRYAHLRDQALNFAKQIVRHTPACDEQRRALDHLDMVIMLANAAIARHEKPEHAQRE